MQTVTVNLDVLKQLIGELEHSASIARESHKNHSNKYKSELYHYYNGQCDAYSYIVHYLRNCTKYEV